MEAVIEKVREKMQRIIAGHPKHFLVEVRINPTNNIKVFIDGDEGVGIDDLVKYNRSLYKQLEEEALFPDGDFSLEVSSPGLGEPLKLYRQYLKNTGRAVEVTEHSGKKTGGKLTQVTDSGIVIEETKGKGKKTELIVHNLSFDDIKATEVQIKF